jgi:hypothetical protein
MLRGSSGFYFYTIFEHGGGWLGINIIEAQLGFKLNNGNVPAQSNWNF